MLEDGTDRMGDPDRLELVRCAFCSPLSTSVYWKDDRTRNRIARLAELQGWRPEAIRREAIAFVRRGGRIEERTERRPEHAADYDFWYRLLIPLDGLPRPLFLEAVLVDDDPEFPEVALVNAHL
jgi:hypothetical protein